MAEPATVSSLKGPEKAAMLLLASGQEHASKLFAKLQIDEIKEITQAMARLGPVPGDLVEELLRDFVERVGSPDGLVGSFHTTERLLGQFLAPDKVAAIMEDVRGPAGRTVWDKLGNVEENVLAAYLKNEYPQTIAVVLSKLRSDQAARVLAALPEEVAIETVQRMLWMELVQKEILNDVEETLRAEFMSNLARTDRRDNHEIMAEIFNCKLGLALKGASEKVRELFFGNMSERASKILRDDMETLGPVRLRDVEDAQAMLVNAAKELAAAGEIFIAGGKDDEMVA
jgi:flagellar motor switch protein FliG